VVGVECIVGKGAYVDFGVRIGARCKLQNGVFVYHGFDVEDGVFIGPGAMLLNDKNPRAINADGTLKSDADWALSRGVVCTGASIGGGAIVIQDQNAAGFLGNLCFDRQPAVPVDGLIEKLEHIRTLGVCSGRSLKEAEIGCRPACGQ